MRYATMRFLGFAIAALPVMAVAQDAGLPADVLQAFRSGDYQRARALLEPATAECERNQPLAPACLQLWLTLGNLRGLTGDPVAAEAAARHGLEIASVRGKENRPMMAVALSNLAGALDDQARYVEASVVLKQALPIRQELHDGAGEARLRNELAHNLKMQGRIAEAIAQYRQALAISEQSTGVGNSDAGAILGGLASALVDLGKFGEAEPYARRALDIARRIGPAGHPDIADAANILGLTVRERGAALEAIRLFMEAFDIRSKRLGPGSSATRKSWINLVSTLDATATGTIPEPLLRELLDLARRSFGARSAETVAILNHIGLHRTALGRLADAEQTFREALAIGEAVGGAALENALANLALNLREQGRMTEAEAQARRLLAVAEQGRDASFTAQAAILLAMVLEDQNRSVEAERMFRQAAERADRAGDSAQIWRAQNGLATSLSRLGRHEEALDIFQNALRFAKREYGEQDPRTVTVLGNLAEELQIFGRFAEAESLHRSALAAAEKQGATSLEALRRHNNLGANLMAQGKLAEAEVELRHGHAIATRGAGPASMRATVTGNLAMLLGKRRKNLEAIALHREAMAIDARTLPADDPDRIARTRALADLLRHSKAALPEAYALYREAGQAAWRRTTGNARSKDFADAEFSTFSPIFRSQVETAWQLAHP